MTVYPLDRCPQPAIDALLGASSLFKQVKQLDPDQFNLLLRNSQILEFRRGEVVIEPGQIDSWLYCLLHGQLAVYVGSRGASDKARKRVNGIVDGELFGDFAVLMDHVRSALIIADTQCKHTTVVRIDFSIFGEAEDVSRVTLQVKLAFYRCIVHNLFSKLDRYHELFPQYPYALSHLFQRTHQGEVDTISELLSLDAQARKLASQLIAWNRVFLLENQ